MSGVDTRLQDGHAPVSLASLDAEIEAGFLAEPVGPVSGGSDQAARLRAMIAGSGAQAGGGAGIGGATGVLGGSRVGPARTARVAVVEEAVVAPAPMTIAVASGKGGVGKTNIAVNLAVSLSTRGLRVVLLDADLGTANADVLCGLSPSARLDHVLGGPLGVHDGARRTMKDIIVEAPGGFGLIPGSAGIARMADLTAPERRSLLGGLAELDEQTDVLIIDTSAGVGRGVTGFIDASDVCLVVTTPEPTSVADAYALIKCAAMTEAHLAAWRADSARCGARAGAGGRERLARFQLVMNQCSDHAEARRTAARIGAVCDRFLGLDVPMAGWVAQDVRVGEAVRARQPVVLRSPTTEAARNMSVLASSLAQQMGLPERPRAGSAPRPGVASVLRRVLLGV